MIYATDRKCAGCPKPKGITSGIATAPCFWKEALGNIDQRKGCGEALPFSTKLCGGKVSASHEEVPFYGALGGRLSEIANQDNDNTLVVVTAGFHEMYDQNDARSAGGFVRAINDATSWPGKSVEFMEGHKEAISRIKNLVWVSYPPANDTINFCTCRGGCQASRKTCNFMLQNPKAQRRLAALQRAWIEDNVPHVHVLEQWEMNNDIAAQQAITDDGVHSFWFVNNAMNQRILNLLVDENQRHVTPTPIKPVPSAISEQQQADDDARIKELETQLAEANAAAKTLEDLLLAAQNALKAGVVPIVAPTITPLIDTPSAPPKPPLPVAVKSTGSVTPVWRDTMRNITSKRFHDPTSQDERYPFEMAPVSESKNYVYFSSCPKQKDGLGFQILYVIQLVTYALINNLTIIWLGDIVATNHHAESGDEILDALGFHTIGGSIQTSGNIEEEATGLGATIKEWPDSQYCAIGEQFGQPNIPCFSQMVKSQLANSNVPTIFYNTNCAITGPHVQQLDGQVLRYLYESYQRNRLKKRPNSLNEILSKAKLGKKYLIGVHIRRGDYLSLPIGDIIRALDASGEGKYSGENNAMKTREDLGIDAEEDTTRINPLGWFRNVLQDVLQKSGVLTCDNSHVVITSQFASGTVEESELRAQMQSEIVKYIGSDCVTLFLSDAPSSHIEPFSTMVGDIDLLSNADVFLTSPYSGFSQLIAYLSAPEQVKLVRVSKGMEKISWWGVPGMLRVCGDGHLSAEGGDLTRFRALWNNRRLPDRGTEFSTKTCPNDVSRSDVPWYLEVVETMGTLFGPQPNELDYPYNTTKYASSTVW